MSILSTLKLIASPKTIGIVMEYGPIIVRLVTVLIATLEKLGKKKQPNFLEVANATTGISQRWYPDATAEELAFVITCLYFSYRGMVALGDNDTIPRFDDLISIVHQIKNSYDMAPPIGPPATLT
jgi:hypothetical protein